MGGRETIKEKKRGMTYNTIKKLSEGLGERQLHGDNEDSLLGVP